jgi:hypothetical protein
MKKKNIGKEKKHSRLKNMLDSIPETCLDGWDMESKPDDLPLYNKTDHSVGVKRTVKLNAYNLISNAVDSGVAYGLRRAYKHTETPSQEDITESVAREVMNEICNVLDFGDGEVEW